MLESDAAPGALLLCLDLQAPFLSVLPDPETLIKRCSLALQAARGLGIPIALTEQVPAKLGPTIDRIHLAAGDVPIIAKHTFSALANEVVTALLAEHHVEHLILCGLETPICVYQTALDALNQDLAVTILSDAVGARRSDDAATVLATLARHGAHVLPLETVCYALLHDTSHPFFKTFTQLVKSHG